MGEGKGRGGVEGRRGGERWGRKKSNCCYRFLEGRKLEPIAQPRTLGTPSAPLIPFSPLPLPSSSHSPNDSSHDMT